MPGSNPGSKIRDAGQRNIGRRSRKDRWNEEVSFAGAPAMRGKKAATWDQRLNT